MLNLHSVLTVMQTSDQGARALLDQHHDTIKWLHSHYSVVGEISVDQAFRCEPPASRTITAGSVTKLQFWRLACDCGLLPKTAPRGEIDAVFSRAVQDLGEGSDPTMAYPAFQEGIMQLAAMKYRCWPL